MVHFCCNIFNFIPFTVENCLNKDNVVLADDSEKMRHVFEDSVEIVRFTGNNRRIFQQLEGQSYKVFLRGLDSFGLSSRSLITLTTMSSLLLTLRLGLIGRMNMAEIAVCEDNAPRISMAPK